MTASFDAMLSTHLDKGPEQEDLLFALWSPSQGFTRLTAILNQIVLPEAGDRDFLPNGTVAFSAEYVLRALSLVSSGLGIAFLHSHLGPGWQGMSADDVIAERDRLAAAIYGYTGLPLVGLTRGTDGSWSARCWQPSEDNAFIRTDAESVRVVGQHMRMTFHPELLPPPTSTPSQVATISVWGSDRQAALVRTQVGIVGLGSVGSIVAEALGRVGLSRLSFIDHDVIELRNLDRTVGSVLDDANAGTAKVEVARRHVTSVATAASIQIDAFHGTLLSQEGLARALDCDVLFSCVDRPAPRHVLNAVAYGHLIPVIDGGILAKLDENDRLVHATWRIHTIGPERPCMVCLGALNREEIALDLSGRLDDPEYIQGLPPEMRQKFARQNVFPFSLSVAAHGVLQMVGLITGETRIGGVGAQTYHCYPGTMEAIPDGTCSSGCEYAALISSAPNLQGNLS